MVREKVVYECKCDKCGYEWITKKAEIPKLARSANQSNGMDSRPRQLQSKFRRGIRFLD